MPAGPTPYVTAQGLPPPAAYPYGSPPRPAPAQGRAPLEPPPGDATLRDAAPPGHRPTALTNARPELVAKARRLGELAVYTAVIGVISSLLFFPVGVVVDVVAVVLGIRARRAAVAAGRSEGISVLSIVLGGVGLSIAIALGAILAYFWGEIADYRECATGANTHVASADCQAAFQDALLRRLGLR